MIRGVAYSPRPAAIALAGLAFALLAGGFDGRTQAALRHGRAAAVASAGALAARRAAAAPFDQAHLQTLRWQIRDQREQLGGADAWARVRETLRDQWRPEGETAADREGFSVRTGAFRMPSPMTADWPGIVATVGALERIPGVGIGLLELAATGPSGPRPMDLVRVTVVVHSRENYHPHLTNENP
jgi:hypothetical protein